MSNKYVDSEALDAYTQELATKINAAKQNIQLANEPNVVVADHIYANAVSREAATTSNVSDGDIAFQFRYSMWKDGTSNQVFFQEDFTLHAYDI